MAVLEPDREQWQQLKAVLTQALKVTASQRAEVLRQLLAHDPALLDCALDMIQYYDTATRRFDVDEGTGAGRDLGAQVDRPREPSAAGPSSDGAPVRPGDFVGPYRVIDKLGEGGMGVVYLAEDQRLGRQVALKFLSRAAPAMLSNPRAQLLSESRSTALLNHSAIVTLHDVFEYGGELVTVMEYVEGRPLDEVIGGEPLPLGFALRLTSQLADALSYAHGRGIIHCDLKPENIHVLANGSPKILDFGLARVLAGSGGPSGPGDTRLFGTPGYLAPERLLGREPTAAADVYALGVIFYQLLTGVTPFRGGDSRQLVLDTITAQPAPPSTLARGVPPSVDDLALRCLAKSPRDRLQPHELTRAIASVLLQVETSPVLDPGRVDRAVNGVARAERSGGSTNLLRTIAVAGGVVLAVAVGSGLLTTWNFNLVTERGAFDSEPFLSRVILGLRSMVFPAVVMTVAVVARSFVQFTARGLMAPRTGIVRGTSGAAPALLAFGLMAATAVGVLVVGFDELMDALSAKLGSAPPEVLAPFGPAYLGYRALYRTVSSLFIVALLVGWRALVRYSAGVATLPLEIRGGAIGVIVILGVLAQAPYKLMVYNQVPVVLVDGMRCYMLGERDPDVRAYCPGWDVPRVRTVSRTTTGIEPCGVEENIFRGVGGRACQVTP